MFAALLIASASLSAPGDPAAPPRPTRPARQERESLEQFLARARAQQLAVQAKLTGTVAMLVAELEGQETTPNPKVLGELGDKLVALGADATPLLVTRIDPGEAAVDKERLRAHHIALALARMDTTAITGELLALLTSGSLEGKRNALRALEGTPDRARVIPVLDALFKTAEGTLRHACLRTLLALRGSDTAPLLAEVLKSPDENLVAMAIASLTETHNAASADAVRAILLDSRRAAAHALVLLAYFRAMPELAREQEALAFVRVASGTAPMDVRIAVVDALPLFQPKLNSELRKAMEPIVTSNDRRLAESGLIALANLGDKPSRKKLLEAYDERVAQNDKWSQAWVDRGDIYVRIGDDGEAAKDYLKAIQLGDADRAFKPDTYVKLAKCYTRMGKFKDAAAYLNRAPMLPAQVRALADDPEFKPLRDSKYGKDAFGLE